VKRTRQAQLSIQLFDRRDRDFTESFGLQQPVVTLHDLQRDLTLHRVELHAGDVDTEIADLVRVVNREQAADRLCECRRHVEDVLIVHGKAAEHVGLVPVLVRGVDVEARAKLPLHC
jgi:hypothetical protein